MDYTDYEAPFDEAYSDESLEQYDDVMLTTTDNPYNPFVDFDKWYAYDTFHGYNSCGLIAMYSYESPDLSELDSRADRARAIERIMSADPTHLYTRAVPPSSMR